MAALPQMTALLVATCGVLGLLLGSFANVVIMRVPEGGSVAMPASACPHCAAPISPRDNVPVVSWLLLRGRCRDCAEPISARYPLVEASMAALFGAVAWRVGLDWSLPGYLLFAWMLVVVAVIDARTRRIPNRLTYPLTPALLALLGAAALLTGAPWLALRATLGGMAAFGALLLLALISPRGMGMGDVKLGGFIGIGLGYLGWGHVVLGVAVGFFLGGVIALALIALRLRGRKDVIPFGPYLAAGAIATLLAGNEALLAYQRASGLA